MLPTELIWTILVLLPKGYAETWRVGLLEVLWKIVEDIIDTQIKMVATFHNVLHEFRVSRGTWTAIMELNMVQGLASIDRDSLLLVFYWTFGKHTTCWNMDDSYRPWRGMGRDRICGNS